MSCICSAFQVIVDHSKHFYTTGFAFTHSRTHSDTGGSDYHTGYHLLIRSIDYSYIHTLMVQHQDQFGVQCIAQGHFDMLTAGSWILPGTW